MKNIIVMILVASSAIYSCQRKGCIDIEATNFNEKAKNDDGSCTYEMQSFTLTIENVQSSYTNFESGTFDTPVGATMAGGAGPGNSYSFTVHGGPGSKLSFATMFVGSNDLFFAPSGTGIDLFSGNTPVSGNVTSQIELWDAGTEVNEMPGAGANQPANQSGPNTGATENGTVTNISTVSDGFTYPSVDSTIKVMIDAGSSTNEFVVTIENLSGSSTAIAPGVWVVHSGANALFTESMADGGNGLESLAEDGDPAAFALYLSSMSGINTPFAPGVWALHTNGTPLYTSGSTASSGLENLAEDGDPTTLADLVSADNNVTNSGIFNTPIGATSAGAIDLGEKYAVTFTATRGESLSMATMFVQSNDLFYGFGQNGLKLWNNDAPRSGDVTSELVLWDAGSENNEYPGVGLNQAPRQSGPNVGMDEKGTVMMVNDGYTYPAASTHIKVTLTLN